MLFFEIPQERSVAEANCRLWKVKINVFLNLAEISAVGKQLSISRPLSYFECCGLMYAGFYQAVRKISYIKVLKENASWRLGLQCGNGVFYFFLNKRCRKVKKIPINNLVLWEFSAGIRRRLVRWRKVRTPQSGIPFEKTGRAPKGSRMESAAENKPPRKR